MNDLVNVKSLMRISKFAKQINRSAAGVRLLGKDNKIDLVEVDGFYFVRVNQKFHDFLKK